MGVSGSTKIRGDHTHAPGDPSLIAVRPRHVSRPPGYTLHFGPAVWQRYRRIVSRHSARGWMKMSTDISAVGTDPTPCRGGRDRPKPGFSRTSRATCKRLRLL